jgi:RHS repeat-associated protein
LDNHAEDVYDTVKITGVKVVDDPQPKNYVSEIERDVFLPPSVEAFVYDDDGNLEKDGRWIYEWNGENRLVRMETRADLMSDLPRQRLEFLYDADGRRIRKNVLEWDDVASVFTPQTSTLFLYAGWNLLAEVTTSGDLIRSYLWGVSESGRLDFTATPGALVGLRDHGTDAFYFAQSDGNGNVMALIAASDGSVAARYDYGPFGEPLLAVGEIAHQNPIRFSSKFTDVETGLFYYGYRYYSPSMGRFLNRDPIEEEGGLNLYGFVGNDPLNRWDYLGLTTITVKDCEATLSGPMKP